MPTNEEEVVRGILGEEVKFKYSSVKRGTTRHIVVLDEVLDPKTEMKVVGSGPTPEDAAQKAKDKIPKP